MEKVNNHQVVCFGEVLWDILPSRTVPGGAPMNVAYHLQQQQKNPAVITRIGNDKEGKELIQIFSKFGICTDFFQVGDNHVTGKVYAKPTEHNEVVYDIVEPAAWDFIEYEDRLESLVSNAEFFVFGSLAARKNESKNTLLKLINAAKTKVLDINLRAPYFNRTILEQLLLRADILKLNLAELEVIAGWFSKYISLEDRVNSLIDRFKINIIVVTKGGDGATLFYEGNEYTHKGYKVNVADTIGSGDAFLAGLLAKLSDKAKPPETLDFASRLGAFVATQSGGCPEYDIMEITKPINF